MSILKVKDWLVNNKPQFRVTLDTNTGKGALLVRRLFDEQEFHRGLVYKLSNPNMDLYKESYFLIKKFHEDLIHVDYILRFIKQNGNFIESARVCEINDILFSEEKSYVFGIKTVDLIMQYGIR